MGSGKVAGVGRLAEGADFDGRRGAVLPCIQGHGRGTPDTDRQSADVMGHVLPFQDTVGFVRSWVSSDRLQF